MSLVRILVIIALLAITISDSFPNAYLSSLNNDPSTIAVKPNIVRREDFDPYGLNSILSRFSKSSNSIQVLNHIYDGF
ncbi:unnamed protein product [Rotaria sp. Silwood1]|nr:unnamed protein product [Rotaria sp. Silwood1]CAF0916784.1 unnamed protein product [Rotaria sp. Silwood1]CAF0943251.1 unnamed protein product [Rotaria sp. Silwood1]CAF3374894.1 unnamed protein product [Rotaria sp. Silwood1]CAF3383172.1 unnamed protein product [Rotaria sp. Silwood1]